jgi:hypothetical protein
MAVVAMPIWIQAPLGFESSPDGFPFCFFLVAGLKLQPNPNPS